MKALEQTLEHYKAFNSFFDKGFIDLFFQSVLHGEDGKNYFLTYAIAKASRGEYLMESGRMTIGQQPVIYFTTPSSKIIRKGETPEINKRVVLPAGARKVEVTSSALTWRFENFEVICTPPDYRMLHRGEDVSVDLTFKSIGPPFWFAPPDEKGLQVTPSSTQWGLESFSDVEGTITLAGKTISVKGVGIHEHVITEHISWLEFGWMDWIWFVFEDMYGLIFDMHGGACKKRMVYFRKEKEYLPLIDFDIDHPQWAFSPALHRQWPIAINAHAVTEKGTLFIEGNVLRSQTWTESVNRYVPAMTMPAADMEVPWKGTFTFNGGRVLTLNNGRGADEIVANFNFAQ